jgi:hypothetical protein
MTEESVPPRNRAARASLVLSLVFFVQCATMLAVIAVAMSSWGTQFIQAHPDHLLANLAEGVPELNLLFFPLDLIAGLAAVFMGLRGLRASRTLPNCLGRNQAIAGIVLGLLVIILPFAIFLCWASAFRQ